MKRAINWSKLLLCVVLACLLLPASAMARSPIDTEQAVSLTIKFPCQGAAFKIFRVADVTFYGTFTPTADFAGYSVSLEQPDQAGWRALASTLAGYAARDGLAPLMQGATDAAGQLHFPPAETELQAGLYLVVGEKCTVGSTTYTPCPSLVSLPDVEKDEWLYDVTMNVKYDQYTPPGGGGGGGGSDTVRRKALKVWKDGDGEDRPAEVTVQLLRNGAVYDAVTLSKANDWSHTWTSLDEDDDWQVVEADVPQGYTVTVAREGITFVVTNTHEPDEPSDPGDPGEPDVPVEGETPEGPLPQTGVIRWPVPLLACGGIALVLTGLAARRREDHEA